MGEGAEVNVDGLHVDAAAGAGVGEGAAWMVVCVRGH